MGSTTGKVHLPALYNPESLYFIQLEYTLMRRERLYLTLALNLTEKDRLSALQT